jgi:SulP family sulfate permease
MLIAMIAAVALTLLLVALLAAYLPIPAMAAILLVVAYRRIDWYHILAGSQRECHITCTTMTSRTPRRA